MPALLEQDLEAARTSWFFEWFHLQPIESERPGEDRLVRFLTRGGAFRDSVALDVEVAPAGKIRALSLGLERRFVDDPADGTFARDLALAFLRAAVPQSLAGAMDLADELGASPPSVTGEGDPPAEPSPAAEVFYGMRADSRLEGSGATVALRNLQIDGEDWLVITAAGTS